MYKIFKRISGVVAAVSLVFGLAGPIAALAATTPSLGAAATYGVLSDTYSNPTGPTTINGDVGFTTAGGVTPLPLPRPSGTYPNYGTGGNYSSAGTAQATALANLNSQPCTFTFVAPAVVLDTTLEHSPTYGPGVYCSTGAMSIGTAGGITLSGAGTYIFRSGDALNAVAGSVVHLGPGASACDVFWTPNGATTLNANSTFIGTVIPVSQNITVLSTTNWTGRALTFGHTVTTPDADVVITVPTCTVPPPPSSGSHVGTITVVKTVINDNGGTKTVADFPLFVNGTPVASGVTNSFPAPAGRYDVTETSDSHYTRTFSGDCDINGGLNLNPGDNKFCIVTNNDIGAPVVVPPVPPLIDVVKVPNPLALPAGPGSVTYTYTVRNVGTVSMSNVTVVDDSCSPVFVSGDANSDGKLDVSETWTYRCSTTLSETHTNNVVATGWANGISAADIASATVVVGIPLVPPLIHVTKVPSPLTLLAGGGMVTYTEKVTNPGTVALSNVILTDDKCSPMTRISGDTNGDSKLDTTETWTYTCKKNLTATTTNTASVSGEANGFTVRDFAIATVVVAAAPALPKTGFASAGGALGWGIAAAGIFAASLLLYVIRKKQTA